MTKVASNKIQGKNGAHVPVVLDNVDVFRAPKSRLILDEKNRMVQETRSNCGAPQVSVLAQILAGNFLVINHLRNDIRLIRVCPHTLKAAFSGFHQ